MRDFILSVILSGGFWGAVAIVIVTGLHNGIRGRTNPITGKTKRGFDEFIIIAWPLLIVPLALWKPAPVFALIIVALMALYCVGELHRRYFGSDEPEEGVGHD